MVTGPAMLEEAPLGVVEVPVVVQFQPQQTSEPVGIDGGPVPTLSVADEVTFSDADDELVSEHDVDEAPP